MLPAAKIRIPLPPPVTQIFNCAASDNAENSSSDDDEDEDDDTATTTTTTSDSMASTSNISLAEPSASGNLTTEQPQKLPKKRKTEIKSTLLADWSDEDDNANSENLPSTSSNSTIVQSTTVVAGSTMVSEKPKYRNIPKKDRRDVIYDEFYSTPSTSAAMVVAPISSTLVGNVIVIDTDESDDEKIGNATGLSKQLKISAAKRTKVKSIDIISESNQTPILSNTCDDHVTLKPHKKRDVAKVRLELSFENDMFTECDLANKNIEDVPVLTKAKDSNTELIEQQSSSPAVVSTAEEFSPQHEPKAIVSNSLIENSLVMTELENVKLRRRGRPNRKNAVEERFSPITNVTSQRRGRSRAFFKASNDIQDKDTHIEQSLNISPGNIIEEIASSEKIQPEKVEPIQTVFTEILEADENAEFSPPKTDDTPGKEYPVPSGTFVIKESLPFESKTDAEPNVCKGKEEVETSRKRVTRSAKELVQPANPKTVNDTKTDIPPHEGSVRKQTQTTSKTSRKGKQPRRRDELVAIVPAIAANVEPDITIQFNVFESLEIPQLTIQEETIEIKKPEEANSDVIIENAENLGVKIDSTVDNKPDSPKEPTASVVESVETKFDLTAIEPSTSFVSELPETHVEQNSTVVSSPIICEIQNDLTKTETSLLETTIEDKPSRSSSKRSRKEKVPVKRNARSEPVDPIVLESKPQPDCVELEVLEDHPQVVGNFTSDDPVDNIEILSARPRRNPIETETSDLSQRPRRSSRCSRPVVLSPSDEQLVEIVKEIDEKCAENDLKIIPPDVPVVERQPENLADTSQLNESDEITDPSPDKSTDTSKDIDCFTFTEEEEEEIPKVLKRRKRRSLAAGKVFELFSIDKLEEQRRQEEEDALRVEKEESNRKLQQEINDLLSSADVPIPQNYTPVKKINEQFSERPNEKNPHEKDKKRIFKSRYTPLKSDGNNVGEGTSTASADTTVESIDSSFESPETPQIIPKSPSPASGDSHANLELDPKPSSLENVFREAMKNDEKRTRKIKSRDTIEQRFSDDKSPTDIDSIKTNIPSESDLQIAETLINLPLLNSTTTQIAENVKLSSISVIPSKISMVENIDNASSVDTIPTKRSLHTEDSEIVHAKKTCLMPPYRRISSEEECPVVPRPPEIILNPITAIPSESIETVIEAITISSSATILPSKTNLVSVSSGHQDNAIESSTMPGVDIDMPIFDFAKTYSYVSDSEVLSNSIKKTFTSKMKKRHSISKISTKEQRRSLSVASKRPTISTTKSYTAPEKTVTPKSLTKSYTASSQMVTINNSRVDAKIIIKPTVPPSNAVTVTTTYTTTTLTTNYSASIGASQANATQMRIQTTKFPAACTSTTISTTKSICLTPSVPPTTTTPRKPAPRRKTPSTRKPVNTEGLTKRHIGYDGHGRDIVIYTKSRDTTPVLTKTTVSQSNNSQLLITSKGGLISSSAINPRPSFNTADTTTSSMVQAMANPVVSTILSPPKIHVQSNRLVSMTTDYTRPTTSSLTSHIHSQPAQTAKRKLATKRKATPRKPNPSYTTSHGTQQPSADIVEIRSKNNSTAVTRDVVKVSTSKLKEFGIIKGIETEKFERIQNSDKPTEKKTMVRRVSRTNSVTSTIVQESTIDAQSSQTMPPLALITDQTQSPQSKQTPANISPPPPPLLITSEQPEPIVEAAVQQFEPPASPTQSNCSSDDPAGIFGIPAIQYGGPANAYYLCRMASNGEIILIDKRALYLGSENQLIPFPTDQEVDETTITDECELQQHQVSYMYLRFILFIEKKARFYSIL